MIQNADDAGADAVKVRITANTVYFADNGEGLKPGAISSISALHLSYKPAQAIGRKGLGFKAVYCVTREPAIFAEAEAVCFNEAEARRFLAANGFEDKSVQLVASQGSGRLRRGICSARFFSQQARGRTALARPNTPDRG